MKFSIVLCLVFVIYNILGCESGAFPPDAFPESAAGGSNLDADCCSPESEVVIDSELTEPPRYCTESFNAERCASWCMVVGPSVYDGGECLEDTCVCHQIEDATTEFDPNFNNTQKEQDEEEDYIDLSKRMFTFDEHQRNMINKTDINDHIQDSIGVIEEDNANWK